ncbi:hypothetical protein ACWEPR_37900 [Streptomyces sp. NPDC004290]
MATTQTSVASEKNPAAPAAPLLRRSLLNSELTVHMAATASPVIASRHTRCVAESRTSMAW